MAPLSLAQSVLANPAVRRIDLENKTGIGEALVKAWSTEEGFPILVDDAADFLQYETRAGAIRKLTALGLEEGRDYIRRPGRRTDDDIVAVDAVAADTPLANIRVDSNTGKGSVIDVIMAVSTHNSSDASKAFTRLTTTEPQLGARVPPTFQCVPKSGHTSVPNLRGSVHWCTQLVYMGEAIFVVWVVRQVRQENVPLLNTSRGRIGAST